MKIVIVGTGISGLVVAYLLSPEHDITVFEANDYIGGHTNTIEVEQQGTTYAIDTGFIVFNDWTYPNFIRLLARLGVASQPSTMSFSVKCEKTGLEYNGTSLNTLFAQRRNLLRPAFYRMVRDILRFNSAAPALLQHGTPDLTLSHYLEAHHYSPEFVEHYLLPMGAAIWSANPQQMRHFPARYFVQFFHNHGMLNLNNRPQWRVITGGSARYVEALTRPYRERVRLRCPVQSITRYPGHVEVKPQYGDKERFDQVVIATHSDQALALLTDPTEAEVEVLSAFPYQENEAILHTDSTLLPRRRRAWASWNYHILREGHGRVAITYLMNSLQNLCAPQPFCVTLNRSDAIDPASVIQRVTYHHPVYTPRAVAAQKRHRSLNGVNRTSFCGAYWGYGFHEDGVNSALTVCQTFGKSL
jgi:predicted NAD/FAD-binding protein